MSTKKTLIIEKAMHLFATKGFESTSIQEITDACGISKGSFYLSFKSKEELHVSIFEYFFEKLSSRLTNLDQLIEETPRDKFRMLLMIQFEEIDRQADFILMHIREQTNPLNSNMIKLLGKMQDQHHSLLKRMFMEVYGEKIEPYLTDLIVMTKGLLHGYLEIIMLHQKQLDYHQLSSFIMDRLDDLVKGILAKQPNPFLEPSMLNSHLLQDSTINTSKQSLLQYVILCITETDDEDLLVTLEVIADELRREEPRVPVLKGMLANLSEVESLNELHHKVNHYLNKK
jgi:AcrR family transcriptional regulator